MAGVPLPVANIPKGFGAIQDLGPAQDGARTFELVSPNGTQGDQVQILGGNEPDLSDAFVVGTLSTTAPLQGGTMGQNSAISSSLVFRYARTCRLAIANPSFPALVCEAGVAQPSGGAGVPAILDGGQSGPISAGTTDATSFTLFAGSIMQAVMLGNGNSTWGSAAGGDTTTVQSGAAMGLNAGTTLGLTGGTGLTATATTGDALFHASAGNTFVDASGTALLGATTATAVTVGGANVTGTLSLLVGAGGQLHAGGGAFASVANSMQLRTGSNGPVTVAANGTGALTLTGGSGGAALDSTGAVTVGGTTATSSTLGRAGANTTVAGLATSVDAAAALTLGTTTATSTAVGRAGANTTVAGLATSVDAAAALTLGTTTATSVTIGNGAIATRINTGGLGINKAAGATALLDLSSTTTLGLRFPNMTSAQKGAIANTAGLVVFDTDLGKLCVNSGAGWQTITSV